MGLINRCSACGLNYTPHGLEDTLYVMWFDIEHDKARKVALCEKCTRKLLAWLANGNERLEEPEDGKEQQDS